MQVGVDVTKRVALQFQLTNVLPVNSAKVEFSQIGPVALNGYALSERRFSLGVRAKF
ncbi:MAG: hypothetical protein ACKVOB_02395 [Sphingomonas sp.]